MDVLDQINRLYDALFALYARSDFLCQHFMKTCFDNSYVVADGAPEVVRRVVASTKQARVTQAVLIHVPSDYYSWSLLKRANALQAPTTDHLCKSLVFENTRHSEMGPRFYMVIVQYTTRLGTEALGKFVQSFRTPKLPNKFFNLRLASPEDSLRLTGYANNGVCPFGVVEPMPVIISKAIMDLKPAVLYLGAGDVDWKMLVRVDELQAATGAVVGPVSL